MTTGHKIHLPNGVIGKDGKLRIHKPPRDASAARREKVGGSRKVKVKRRGAP